MTTYNFLSHTTMKEYNRSKYWIDYDIISPFRVDADTLENALKLYSEYVNNKCYIEVSKTALKRKKAMYIDTKNGETIQTGYVITGATDIENTTQYIDIWVEINVLENPFLTGKKGA